LGVMTVEVAAVFAIFAGSPAVHAWTLSLLTNAGKSLGFIA